MTQAFFSYNDFPYKFQISFKEHLSFPLKKKTNYYIIRIVLINTTWKYETFCCCFYIKKNQVIATDDFFCYLVSFSHASIKVQFCLECIAHCIVHFL